MRRGACTQGDSTQFCLQFCTAMPRPEGDLSVAILAQVTLVLVLALARSAAARSERNRAVSLSLGSGAMGSVAEAELARVLAGIQTMLQRQATGMDQLAAQAAAVDDRFAQGESNLQTAMTSLEKRLSDSEHKLADAFATLSGTMAGFRSGLEHPTRDSMRR